MKTWVKNISLILISIIILMLYFPLVSLLTPKEDCDKTKYNILLAERDSLKAYLESLTNLNYNAYNYTYGKVVLRELYNFTEQLTIKTSKEVNKGSLVVNENGVIGIISHTNKDIAMVELLTNKNTALSIKINGLYGKLKFKNNLIIEDIPKEKVNVGDEVYTSGLTSYPEGLLIGKVNKIGKFIEIESEALTNIKWVIVLEGERV